ncbi:MAG: hypothetical protein LAO07_16475 [Acidobacteriia bacterium]|nr:hypothetical protein [Terriglobia bacterium]
MNRSNLSWRSYFGSALVLGGIVLVLAMLGASPTGTRAQENRGLVGRTPGALPATAAERRGPEVIAPESVVFGRSYGEWSAAWWQWAFSIPVASHPLFDNADCSVGQSGPVWFLGGKFCATGPNAPPCTPGAATRSCALPRGIAVFFPITNVEDSAPEEPNFGCGDSLSPLLAGTIAEMRQCAASFVNTTGLSATIDGSPVPHLRERFRVQSSAFGFTLPEDNLLNAIGEGPFAQGTYFPSVDDGFYVMLAPLPAGSHVLHIQAGTSQDITYDLEVSK